MLLVHIMEKRGRIASQHTSPCSKTRPWTPPGVEAYLFGQTNGLRQKEKQKNKANKTSKSGVFVLCPLLSGWTALFPLWLLRGERA